MPRVRSRGTGTGAPGPAGPTGPTGSAFVQVAQNGSTIGGSYSILDFIGSISAYDQGGGEAGIVVGANVQNNGGSIGGGPYFNLNFQGFAAVYDSGSNTATIISPTGSSSDTMTNVYWNGNFVGQNAIDFQGAINNVYNAGPYIVVDVASGAQGPAGPTGPQGDPGPPLTLTIYQDGNSQGSFTALDFRGAGWSNYNEGFAYVAQWGFEADFNSSTIATQLYKINFTGAGVNSVTNNGGGQVTVDIAGGGGGGTTLEVFQDGSDQGGFTGLDFVGPGWTNFNEGNGHYHVQPTMEAQYSPGNGANWAGSAPTNGRDALDRLAAAWAGSFGPVP